jgi:nucleotide-binding universal stress UspA family protein
MKMILVATDGSEASQLAVREGLELAKDTGAAVTVVTARQPISFIGAPYDSPANSRVREPRSIAPRPKPRRSRSRPPMKSAKGNPADRNPPHRYGS